MTEARYLALGSYLCLSALVLASNVLPAHSIGDLADALIGGFALLGLLGAYYALVRRDLIAGVACIVPVGLTLLFLYAVFQPRD